MKLNKAGEYVVYNNKSYQFRVHGKNLIIYGNETDNFESYILDYEFVETGVGIRKIDYNEPVTIYKKEISISEVDTAYDLHYEAEYQGEHFLALVDPNNSQITLHTGDDAIARKFGFRNYSKGEWVKDIDISEIELIPVKEPIDLTIYLPKNYI